MNGAESSEPQSQCVIPTSSYAKAPSQDCQSPIRGQWIRETGREEHALSDCMTSHIDTDQTQYARGTRR